MIALIVPSGALALTSANSNPQAATAAPAPLQAWVTPQRTHLHDPVLVTGIAPALDAGKRAIVEAAPRRSGAWRPIASTSITSSGHFRLRVALHQSGFIRVTDSAPAAAITSLSLNRPVNPSSGPLAVAVGAQFEVPRRALSLLGSGPAVVRGHLLPARAGRTVALEGHTASGWQTLTRTRTGLAGGFRLRVFAASGVERRLRVVFAGDRANTPTIQPAGRLTAYSPSPASWYDDGGSTACGFHAGLGVANRSLPCGTHVRISYGGRSVTATVDDRGPFVGGRDWDLNQNTAAALGFGGVGTVWVAP